MRSRPLDLLTADNVAGFANNLQMLGARDTYLDRLNGSLVFRANRSTLASIEAYVKQLRAARAMIVYEGKAGLARSYAGGDPRDRCGAHLKRGLTLRVRARAG